MNAETITPEVFEYGSTWLRADFHLHTKADREFKFDEEESYYLSNYVNELEKEEIRVGVIANHHKFDFAEFKSLIYNSQSVERAFS